MPNQASITSRYALSIATVVAATVLRLALGPILHQAITFAFFLIAIIVTGRYGGFGPAVLSFILGGLGAAVVYAIDDNWLALATPVFLWRVASYVLIGGGIIWLTRSERMARGALEASVDESRQQQHQLERRVAERRELDRQLRQRQQHLELVLQAGRLGLWTWDIGANQVEGSATHESIHGRPAESARRQLTMTLDTIHPDDRSVVEQAIRSALTDRPLDRVTYRVIWPDGSIHWVEAAGQVFRDEAGAPTQVLGVSIDITHLKLTELSLRAAEERFRQLAQQAPVGIAESDADGNTFFVNACFCEIVGAPAEQICQHGWQHFLHADDRERFAASAPGHPAADQAPPACELRLVRPNGDIRWVMCSASAIRSVAGKTTGQIGTLVDITEQRRLHEAVRSGEAILQSILDNTTAVVYLKDLAGQYVTINRQFEQMFHLRREQIVGRTDNELFPAEHAARFRENDATVFHAGKPILFEESVPQDDGLHHFVSIKFPIKDSSGNVVSIGGISTDVSQLKRATDELRAERETLQNLLEVQENEKQLICADIHDGMIQYVAGSLMALEGHTSKHPSIDGVVTKAIDNLRRAVDEGRRVIRGVRPSVLGDYGVIAAIRDLVDQMASAGLMVDFRYDDLEVPISPQLQTTIYRVAQEALNNARRHSRSSLAVVRLRQLDGQLLLEIEDQGIGFDPDRLSNHTFGVRGMKLRVRLAGGECTIDSSPGRGTRVRTVVPIDHGTPDPTERSASENQEA